MTDTMSTHHSESESASTRSGNSVTCRICKAVYAPAKVYEYLLQAPRVALESAFMSMCHFCFRCRRPACPGCWDYVHGVCGECTLEAHLPFRSPGTPLRGVLFPPVRQTQLRPKRASQTRLICIQPGKFQNRAPLDAAETMLIETIATEHPSSRQAQGSTTKVTPLPPVSPLPKPQSITPPAGINIDEIVTKPERQNSVDIDEIATKPERSSDISEIATKPEPHSRTPIDEIVTRPGRRRSTRRQVARVLASVLLALLLFVLALIVLAAVFQDVNALILQLIHVDIRVEIAYILLLIKQVLP
ncbi:MAG: hypothetical protein H0U76_01830 [Ktedonobacteraceae bacterium]|nr:hypothetical protein [Ktedonobacteraceae bacterium]